MSLLGRSSRRYLLKHPGQLVLSTLGVALGVAVVVSIDLAIQSSREAFRASAETVAGRATHSVTGDAGSLDERLLRTIRVELGIRAAAPVVEGLATSPSLPGRVLRLLGVDPFSEAPFRRHVAGTAAGFDVSRFVSGPGAVVLSTATAASAGVRVGDALPVSVDGRPHDLVVAGLVDPVDDLERAGTRDLLLIDISTAQDLLGARARLSRIDVRLPEGEEGEREGERIRRILPPDARLEPAGTRAALFRGMIDAFDLNLTALSLLGLVFGMFLIYNAMTFSVVQRRELLGGLRALGVTRSEILRLVLTEAAAVGSAGALIGTALGVALGRGLVGMVTRTINDLYFVVSVGGVFIPRTTLVYGVALGVGATLAASLVPALEAATTPPRAARLRSTIEERARRMVPRAAWAGAALGASGGVLLLAPTRSLPVSFAALSLVILGLALLAPLGTVGLVAAVRPALGRVGGVLGTMAARGVVTALSRTAPAIVALVVAVSVTVGLGVMIQSFRGTLVRWLDGTLQADVYVSLPSAQASHADGTLDPEVVRALVSHPAVEGRSTYRGREIRLEEGWVRLVALDLDPRGEASFDLVSSVGAGTFRDFRSSAGLLVSEPFAYRQDLEAGDTVALPTPSGARPFVVAGVFHDYGSDQGVVMMSRPVYDGLFDDPGVTSLGLFLTTGSDVERVVAELEERVAAGPQVVIVRTNTALRDGSLQVFERTFRVTGVLRLLAFTVAFVGVLSAFMALELERVREWGVLRANGMTPGQLWGLITTQTGLMGLVAGILSLPLGLVLSVVMIHVVNKRSFGWSLRMEVSPGVLFQAVGLALLGSLLAGLLPAWRMSRTSPATALRGE